MVFVPRFVSVSNSVDLANAEEQPKPFETYFEEEAIILLGDSGAGKTRLFKHAADLEGGEFIDVRRFLRSTPTASPSQPLYIDALDEVRARNEDGHAVLDQLIAKLEGLGKPKFRLSCRAADWFGRLDESHIRDASSDGTVRVLHLCPLTEADAYTIVQDSGYDADQFVRKSIEHGLAEWLTNPRDIKLLIEALTDGLWPKSRRELYRRACASLTREMNEAHAHTARGGISSAPLIEAAGFLCTVHLIAGSFGLALHQSAQDQENPWIGDLSHPEVDGVAIKEVVRRRLFRLESPERVHPVHRSVAEYLAARFLSTRLREGLSLNRILRLLTTHDGAVPTELRGLWAWLISLIPDYAAPLLRHDPLAIVLYGDVSEFNTQTRRRLLTEIVAEAERDPYFKIDPWRSSGFEHLVTADLEADLAELIASPDTPWRLCLELLYALAANGTMTSMGDLLLEVSQDRSRKSAIRTQATKAFCKICPGRTSDMLKLLGDVREDEDPGDQIRAALCRGLHPHVLSAIEVLDYLPHDKPDEVSDFLYFLSTSFLDDLRPDQIVDLLDALAEWRAEPDSKPRSWKRLEDRFLTSFFAAILGQGLAEHGTSIDLPRLRRWLGIHVNQEYSFGRSVLEEEEATQVRAWLKKNPGHLHDLYIEIISTSSTTNLRENLYNLAESCCQEAPPDLALLLFEKGLRTSDDSLAHRLIGEAARDLLSRAPSRALSVLGSIWLIARENGRILTMLERSLSSSLKDEIYLRNLKSRQQEREAQEEEEEDRRTAKKLWLLENLAGTESSEHIALHQLVVSFLNLRTLPELSPLSPEERLEHLWTREIGEAACEGYMNFVHAMAGSKEYNARRLGEKAAKSLIPWWAYSMIAGMSLIWEKKPQLARSLSDDVVSTAVACHFITDLPASERPRAMKDWLEYAIERFPEACTRQLHSKPQ